MLRKVYLLDQDDKASRYKAVIIVGANLPCFKWEEAKLLQAGRHPVAM